jgi:ornithine carbamoyltransferase
MFERRGRLDGVTLAYVGDGNNMCQGLMSGAVKLGVE